MNNILSFKFDQTKHFYKGLSDLKLFFPSFIAILNNAIYWSVLENSPTIQKEWINNAMLLSKQ